MEIGADGLGKETVVWKGMNTVVPFLPLQGVRMEPGPFDLHGSITARICGDTWRRVQRTNPMS